MSDLFSFSPLEVIRAGNWRSALFTTYALSLGFFEGAVLPSLQRAGSRTTTILSDPEGIAGALTEAGARHVGRAYAVEPVAVAGGVFHPKLCSLLSEDGPHLIIGSGNLTFGGWGRNVEVIDHLFPQAHPAAFADMAAFLNELPYALRVSLDGEDALSEHVAEIGRAAAGATEGSVRVLHNLDRGIAPQLVDFAATLGGAERLTVASPYFGGPRAVVALASELGVEKAEIHVASKVAVNGEHYPFHTAANTAPIVIEALGSEERANSPLHAKLIEIACARGRLLLSGSMNASRRALSEPINVEVGVLRIVDDRKTLPRRPHTGELPELPDREERKASEPVFVARCEYAGGILRGTLLCPQPAGDWVVSLDAAGEREVLGTTSADNQGGFRMEAAAIERIVYSPRRTILTFARGNQRVRGFLSFTDVLSASRRLGPIAGPLLRIAAGSDEDDDWIGILEWFARNPEQTATAWRSSPRDAGPMEKEDQLVRLSALAPQPDRSSTFQTPPGGSSAATLDRLLARLRIIVRGAEPAIIRARADATDDSDRDNATKASQQRRTKLANAFERLVAILSERVPADPTTELKRLAELGVHVLLRHADDPERITAFLRQWIYLASEHLKIGPGEPELRKLTVALVGLSAAYDNAPKRARRQLLDVLEGEPQPDDLILDVADPDLRSVVDLVGATVGVDCWLSILETVAEVRVGLDDVRAILAALADNRELPEFEGFGQSEDLKHLKQLIARGKLNSIYKEPRSRTGCPKCNYRLPIAHLEQFRQTGLVRNECCNGIMLRSDA